MTVDVLSILEHAAVLALALCALRVWLNIDRLVYRAASIALFCVGQYGWALLVLAVLCMAEKMHRELIFERRALGFYNGPWTD